MEPMRSKRRASPSLRIIYVDVGWPAVLRTGPRGPTFLVLRRGRPWPRVRVLRTPTEPRARYAPTLAL